jgi:hypothetical protein
MFLPVLNKLQLWGAATVAFLGILVAAFFKGRSSGIKKEQIKELKEEKKELEAAHEVVTKTQQIEVAVDRLPHSDVTQRLRDNWTHD